MLEAAHGTSLNEKRLLYLAISKIYRKERDKYSKYKRITVTAQDYADVFQIQLKEANRAIKKAAYSLKRVIIKIRIDDKIREFNWVDIVTYSEYAVELVFSVQMQKQLFEFSKYFTKFFIDDVSKLDSQYAQRLVEWIMQYKQNGYFDTTLTNFCFRLNIPASYDLHEIKRRVIHTAIADIESKYQTIVDYLVTKKPHDSVIRFDFVCE